MTVNFPGADPGFFRRGCTRLLLYLNTNKSHSFFFFLGGGGRIPVVLENRRSSRGGEGAHPLHMLQLWGKSLWVNIHFGFYTQSTCTLSSSSPTQTTVLDTRTYTCSFSRVSKLVWVEKGEKGSSV